MKIRVAVAALLGGLTLFCWGAISHMVLQLGDAGMRMAPAAPQDQALLDAVTSTLPENGLYGFPGMNPAKHGDPEEMAQYMERTKTQPHGIVVVHHEPYLGMNGQLARELVTDACAALIAAILLACVAGHCASYAGRVGFVAGLGLLIAFRPVQLWNWFGFPAKYTHAQILDGVLGFLALGLVIAAIVKRPQPTGAPGSSGTSSGA
jgi:hypothetical protein